MRAADLASGGVQTPVGIIEKPGVGPRFQFTPTPRFEPRRVYHPQPAFDRRDTIHIQPRVVDDLPPPPKAPLEPEMPSRLKSPIQPPWKILPWKTPVPPQPQIKVIQRRPDIVNKGSLIDFFI
jgi:hypothetical protein